MRKIVVFILIFYFSNAYSQSVSLKKDSIEISNYLKVQKLKNSDSIILIINDKTWVDLIKKYSDDKQEYLKKKWFEKLRNKSIGERFVNHDPTVEAEMISIFQNSNNDSINKLLKDIINNSNSDIVNIGSVRIVNLELKNLLFESLKNPELESNTATALFVSKIECYQQALKDRLLSGKSSDELQLFIELRETDFGDVIDYFFNSLLTNSKYNSELIFSKNNFVYYLYDSYFYNKWINSDTRDKIISYSLKLLEKFPIDIDLYKRHSESNPNRFVLSYRCKTGTQLDLVSFLLYSGNENMVPLIDKLKTIGLPDNLVFKFLNWKFGIDRSEENFNILLKDFKFFNYLLIEAYNQGILTAENEEFFVKMLSEIEKPAVSFGLTSEYNVHKLEWYDIPRIFSPLERDDFIKIINKSLNNEQSKEDFTKIFNKRKTLIYRLIKTPFDSPILMNTKNLPNNWYRRDSHNYSFGMNLPERYYIAADSLKKALNDKNYKVFNDFEFTEFGTDATSSVRKHFKAMQHNSNNELRDLSYFCDVKYVKQAEDVAEEEFNCYVFMNEMAYFMKINNRDDTIKLIYNDLSPKILTNIRSHNRLIPLNFYGGSDKSWYVFGNPETVKEIFVKFDFKD